MLVFVFVTYLSICIYDSQIAHHNPCFNLFKLHNNSFDNQGSEMNNNIFLRFSILSFTKTLFLYIYTYVYRNTRKIHAPMET